MGFRLVLTSMTLNAVIAFILRFFSPNSTDFQADYVTVVEVRPIMSAKYCLSVSVFHCWPKLTHPAARYLCNSWATCIQSGPKKTISKSLQLVYMMTQKYDPCIRIFITLFGVRAKQSNSVKKNARAIMPFKVIQGERAEIMELGLHACVICFLKKRWNVTLCKFDHCLRRYRRKQKGLFFLRNTLYSM